MSTPESDDLSRQLRLWIVEPPAFASFQHAVWQRIAARQTEREKTLWPRFSQWLFAQLVRPRYATALIVVSLSAGIGLAHVTAQGSNAKNRKLLEARYTESVDPLAMNR